MFRVRFAFVAMLAAFGVILAACGGGGGAGNMARNGGPNTGGQPAPQPGTGGAQTSDFFPVTSSHAVFASGFRAWADEEFSDVVAGQGPDFTIPHTTGATLQNLVTKPWTDRNFIQFSEFDFGSATDNDGIMLSKASAQGAGRYNAIAYQGILDHSMFLFQGGIYNYPRSAGNSVGQIGSISYSIGTASPGNAIAGTWEGIAVAAQHDIQNALVPGTRATHSITGSAAAAERRIVRGDIEIGIAISGGTSALSFEFSNWQGGTVNFPDGPTYVSTADGSETTIDGSEFSYFYPGFVLRDGLPDPSDGPWGAANLTGHFYGPQHQEVGGWFRAHNIRDDAFLAGVFGAKKQ